MGIGLATCAEAGVSTPGVYYPPSGFFDPVNTLIDFDRFPSGDPVPPGTDIRDQYAKLGITFSVVGGPASRQLQAAQWGTDFISPSNSLAAWHNDYCSDNRSVTVVIDFAPGSFRCLPRAFGLVFTDSAYNDPFTVRAFDTNGVAVDSVTINTADNNASSTDHTEDTFVGLTASNGIRRVEYTTAFMMSGNCIFGGIYGFEIDNLQFSPSAIGVFNLIQVTDRGGGGSCTGCCGIDHRQPILNAAGTEFVFSSLWNQDEVLGNLNPERNRELFRYSIASNRFLQATVTTEGQNLPFACTDTHVAFISSSSGLPGNADTNVDLFMYSKASPTNVQAVTVTTGPAPGGPDPSSAARVARWASRVTSFSSQYSGSGWSAAQALGPPNTYPTAGDLSTAWASATADAQREFLELAYDNPEPADGVAIYETYHPGAVDRIAVRDAENGAWEVVWSGQAAAVPEPARVFQADFPRTAYRVDAVRVDINSPAVGGWNEIDAVSVLSTRSCAPAWFAGTNWGKVANIHADLSARNDFLVWASNRNLPSAGAPGGMNLDENYEVYWKAVLSGEVRQLTATTGGDSVSSATGANLWPRVSADGSRIVFVSNRPLVGPAISSNRYGIFLVGTNGTIQRLTTAEIATTREFPAFGMDATGSRIVFASDADLTGLNTNHTSQVFAFDLSSSNLTQITRTGSGVTNSRPILSGDGQKVAFVSNGNLNGSASNNVEQLWVFHFDTDLVYADPFIQVTSLTSSQSAGEGRISWADWYSFDYAGSKLVFACNADLVGSNAGHAYEIFLASFGWQPFKCSISKVSTNQYLLNWPSGGYGSYTVESCTSLVNSVWLPVAPTNQWPISRTSWTNIISPGDPQQFFRVRAN